MKGTQVYPRKYCNKIAKRHLKLKKLPLQSLLPEGLYQKCDDRRQLVDFQQFNQRWKLADIDNVEPWPQPNIHVLTTM